MSKLDRAKEQIAYLKLWLGILIATIISLTGWLISNFQQVHWLLVLAAIFSLLIISLGSCNRLVPSVAITPN